MNVSHCVLLALTSAALFVAAPISAQKPTPGTVTATVAKSVRLDVPDRPAPYYALKIDANADRFRIFEGRPGVPVALMLGPENGHLMLPGNAVLRLEPLVVFILGEFDARGMLAVPLDLGDPQPGPHLEFFMQALSIAESLEKLCTSELIWVRTDLARDWQFALRG